MRAFVIAVVLLMLPAIAHAQCGPNGTMIKNPLSKQWDCTGKTGVAGYTTTFTGAVGLTVTAATHGQGTKPVGFCYDNATPADLIAQTSNFPTVATNGDIVFAWSGAKTGYCVVSALGTAVGPTGATGATGAAGPAPSGTGAVIVTAGSASTVNAGTAGHYLRDTGSAFASSTIQSGDVPTLNQNTTGTAAALAGGSGGQVPFQTGAGATGFSSGLAYNDTSKILGLIGGFTAGQTSTATGTYKINGTTSGTVTITGASAAGTWTLTLPTSGGTNGQCLQTNGSGVTVWGTCGSGGGATIPSTTSVLKGDGAGNASAVTGTGTDCVHVNGSSGACVSGGLSGSGTIDFPSLVDGACADSTFTLTGAVVGDKVAPGWPTVVSSQAGFVGKMQVSAADTVQVRVCNFSGSTVDLASATYGAGINGGAAGGTGNGDPAGYTIVTYSTTPSFIVTKNTGQAFQLTLTGDATASVDTTGISNSGRTTVTMRICQDSGGSHSFTWPSSFLNHGTVDSTASSCSSQPFIFDGTNFQSAGPITGTGIADSVGLPGSTSGLVRLKAPAVAGSGDAILLAGTNTVVGIADPSDTHVINYIGTDGVQHRIAQSGVGGGSLLSEGQQSPVTLVGGGGTTIWSVAVPSIAAGGCVYATWAQQFTGSATITLHYGSGSVNIFTLSGNNDIWEFKDIRVCNDPAVQNAQHVSGTFSYSGGIVYFNNNVSNYSTALSVDSTTSQTLSLTATGDGANALTLYGALVEAK